MILYFNPGHENAVMNGSPYYMAPANVQAMQHELAFLPAWYAMSGDAVLVDREVDKDYISYLSENLKFEQHSVLIDELENYKGEEVALWGISLQAIHIFDNLNSKYNLDLKIPLWHKVFIYLNSREAAKDTLERMTRQLPQISETLLPRFFNNLDAIEDAVSSSQKRLLAKAPYSSSGRGLLWLPADGLTRTERQILHGVLKKQNTVSIEYVLDRQLDFAMEFMSDGKGNIEFAGYSLFTTNVKGAYLGNYIGSQEYIKSTISDKVPISLLDAVKDFLIADLANEYASVYKGCIGVDMMIYKDGDSYALHPCVEINMRYNMGLLAVRLSEKYVAPTSFGKFFLDFSAKPGDIYEKHLAMNSEYPAQFENSRLVKGYLPLCPVCRNSRYWAYINIESHG